MPSTDNVDTMYIITYVQRFGMICLILVFYYISIVILFVIDNYDDGKSLSRRLPK